MLLEIIILFILLVAIYSVKHGSKESISIDDVVNELKKYNSARVIKFLQIKGNSKSLDIKELVEKIINKKNITPEKFISKISDFTFMTAPQREDYFRNLNLLQK